AQEDVWALHISYFHMVQDEMKAWGESDSSIGHGGEWETSLQLHLREHLIAMDRRAPNGLTSWFSSAELERFAKWPERRREADEVFRDHCSTKAWKRVGLPLSDSQRTKGDFMERKKHLYQHYTWPELGEMVKTQPVVVLPIGSVEDHGPHLPLDTDNFLIWNICEEAAQRADGEILLLPLVPYGFESHHMDFPGTIDIHMDHLLNFVLDITKSVAHHGFKRILIADGHGSNMPILELVARRTILETNALCAAFIWPSLAIREIRAVRESERSG